MLFLVIMYNNVHLWYIDVCVIFNNYYENKEFYFTLDQSLMVDYFR